MQEFFKEYYAIFNYSIGTMAAVTGLFFLNKYKSTAAKYLIYFLVYALLVDVIGRYPSYFKDLDKFDLIKGTLIEANYWWYIIFWFAGLSSFITLVNFKVIYNLGYKKALKYCYYVYIVQFVLYGIFNFESLFNPMEVFLKISSIWMIFVAVFLYLLDILQSFRITYFYKSIYFYINIAILIWTLVTGPIMFYEVYFSTADWNFVILKWQIFLSVNFIFYLTLSLALIYCKTEIK
ncbi:MULTISPECIES: hypothetical protein [Winogradskyella]|uniref:hypothetical protein n=1 Tax=Winogradskyella TaxID=286104 RepID=UPI0015C6B943|nr:MULTISPECIES: hypothetical protein [Winogradskyella]QXP78920.1 hypothetical protein H0I32_17220 [Winogradskyella sp. HaHa_3_26]